MLRATDQELYACIPQELNKILVLDEWYHKDFYMYYQPRFSESHFRKIYEENISSFNSVDQSYHDFVRNYKHKKMMDDKYNKEAWENDRPSSYETWQLIAKVIVNKDASYYKPTLPPNTHWRYWPESGAL